MYKKTITKLATTLIEQDHCSSCDRELVEYGLISALEVIKSAGTCLVIALLMKSVQEYLVFLVSFSWIRSYSGGFHCKKSNNCYLLTVLTITMMLLLAKTVSVYDMMIISPLITIVAVPVFIYLAPIASERKPLDDVEKVHFRKMVLCCLFTEVLLMVALLVTKLTKYSFIVSLSIFITSFWLIVEAIRQNHLKARRGYKKQQCDTTAIL